MASDDDVVPDLDRLSILVPSPMIVSLSAPRSIGSCVGADLDVVLDDDTADLRHFQVAGGAHGETEAVLADAERRA